MRLEERELENLRILKEKIPAFYLPITAKRQREKLHSCSVYNEDALDMGSGSMRSRVIFSMLENDDETKDRAWLIDLRHAGVKPVRGPHSQQCLAFSVLFVIFQPMLRRRGYWRLNS